METAPAPSGPPRLKPLLRGWSHRVAFFVAILAGGLLLAQTSSSRSRGACLTYVTALVVLFGVSALYHRPMWRPRVRSWLGRLDHSAIFLMIAGTYTPFSHALSPGSGATLFCLAWFGAGLGSLVAILWPKAPKPIVTATYLTLGWMSVWFLPELERALGPWVLAWIVGGGLLYTLGALAYALRRPDPWPAVFGYHEIFHAFVIAAAICHFVAVQQVLERTA
jgi:hemolysin III